MASDNIQVNLNAEAGFSLRRILALGEPLIWLAGAAMAFILFMILAMLGLVLFEGASFFWPRPVQQLTLKDGSRLAGVERSRLTYLERDEQGQVTKRVPRLQLMLANRDLLPADFTWVDLDQVASAERPRDIVYVERQEWGPFIGWVAGLEGAGGRQEAASPGFEEALARSLEEGARRARRLRRLEQGALAAVNHQLEELRLEQRRLELRAAPAPAGLESLQARRGALEARFRELQAQLEALRSEDEAARLSLRSLEGREKSLPASAVVRLHYPNRLGLFGRLGIYAARLWEFLSQEPRESNTEGGVFPAIFGTVLMSLLMTLAVVPFGVVTALYLREYAKQGPLVSAVRIAVNNLAGVPSVVFGIFGLGFFVYGLGGGIDRLFFPESLPTPTFGSGGILWASLTLALLTVPVVVVATEEALAFVPKGIREGSLAAGASRWQMIRTVVLPASAPGILTGVILAMARGAGEVAPLMITGVVKLAPELALDGSFPFFHPSRKFMHLGFHIYDVGFQSPNVEAAMPMVYTTTLLLILVIVGLNVAAMLIRNRLRSRYRSSAF